ncbi:MAG: hypothetical protein LBC17_01315, partial [Lactobacillaceae bacterium]|nr:hypothetical protein [Lactobacillaceae bacterium]
MNAKKIMFWIKWNLINRYREFYSRTKIFSRLDKSDALGLLLTINVFVTIFTIAILYLLYLAFIHFIGTNIKSVLATLLIIISLIPDVDRAKDSWQWGSLSAQNKEFLIYGTPLNEKQANFYSSIEGLSFQFTNYLVGYFIIYTFFLTIIGMPIYQSIMITIMLVLYKLSMTMFVSNVLSYVVTTVQRFSRILFTLVKHTLLIVFIYFIF